MNKNTSILMIFLMAMIMESLFNINVYIIIIGMSIAIFITWHLLEKRLEYQNHMESRQLQNKINSTSKDAYLKYKQLVTVMNNLPFPILLVDQKGTLVMHNQQMETLADTMSENDTYLHNAFPHEVQEFIKDAFILEKELDQMLTLENIEYRAISVPVTTNRKFSGCLLMFQNISKTLEGEKMQKRFIADASHELKTPISVMKGMLEILNRPDFHDSQTEKEFLKQMARETDRLEILVKEMLDLSRLSVTNPILDRRKVDLKCVLQGVIESFHKAANDKGLIIEAKFDNDEEVFCDLEKMTQVFTNLIGNAVKYSEHGKILVHTYQEDPYYVVAIQDQGHGLDEEQKEKIFHRFYRVDSDRSRKSGGLGLGLAITKSIIDAHSGKIDVESTLGKGSTFYVKLKN